ncbi:tetratricopeptide repeat protein [Salinispora arenicola]|uniref:Co-chaperone YbbN n=1 Tax=Salinispora arenicola TaxID=168697 RepID=A0A542XNC6_SALAC|nr:tetratricopeptide repeat protein [Salinispora arenicola]MCN0154548.1 tetratricopeptide repeat protein [Salinispora arenicola]MCN0180397.1 tetratricopeptide repeat protein [Salinispora arenicola]NIL39723.1 tetratricopeptide repeat protein [Salinispora arenicola]TQL37344.1 putative thioredoxin [Salinispora arenicola]GIM87422.1 co-chaperone YbbN [Salinispora arenicola]
MSDPRITPSIFTRGAVDLSALRTPAPSPAPAPAPAQPGPTDGGVASTVTVIDVSEATFQTEVLERSLSTPVVVDFWAEWCQPCKQLSPVLERLAVEDGGAWVLAKVDVDANPRLAQMFRVQGIPMVYAVVGGQPVDAFSGVVPEAQLRQWIQAVLKAGGATVAETTDPRLDEADDSLLNGDLDAAEQAYRKILAETPSDAAAEAGLAQVGLARRVAGSDPQAVLAAAAAATDDIDAQLLAADVEVLGGMAEQAYQRLVGLVRRTAGDDREKARQHLVGLFTIAGPDDAAVASARRALASALF